MLQPSSRKDSHYQPVHYQKRVGSLSLTDQSLIFQDAINQTTKQSKPVKLQWTHLQTIKGNLATSGSTAMLRVTDVQGRKLVFRFEARSTLEKARGDMKDRWKTCHDKSMRNLDDQDFSESRRGGCGDDDDELPLGVSSLPPASARGGFNRISSNDNNTNAAGRANLAAKSSSANRRSVHPPKSASQGANTITSMLPLSPLHNNHEATQTSTPITAAKTTSATPVIVYREERILRVAQGPTSNSSNGNTNRPIIQVLPHNQIMLPRRHASTTSSNQGEDSTTITQEGHYVLDFGRFPETQQIKVTTVSQDFEQDEGQSYMLRLDEQPTDASDSKDDTDATRQSNETNQDREQDVEAPQRQKRTALQTQSSSLSSVVDVAGYRISKQVVWGTAITAFCCLCILLVTTLVFVVLSVTIWSDGITNGGGNAPTDDFYAGFYNRDP